MPEFQEHQSVRTLRRVGEIAPGTRGCIVHVYPMGDAYEVEFPAGTVEVDGEEFRTFEVEFVDGADLAPA
ncbi:MAG TPA: hypothetical protein VFL96_06100 [Acidobacteriaceae bacterium]|nr:hypothetical protein [Acidobacteriaceae bacterium]